MDETKRTSQPSLYFSKLQLKAIIEKNNKRLQKEKEKKKKEEEMEAARNKGDRMEGEEEEEEEASQTAAEMRARADAFFSHAAQDQEAMLEEPSSHQRGVSWQPSSSSPLPQPDLSFLTHLNEGCSQEDEEGQVEAWEILLSQGAITTLIAGAEAKRGASSSSSFSSSPAQAIAAALYDTLAFSSDPSSASAARRELLGLFGASRGSWGSLVDLERVSFALRTLGVISHHPSPSTSHPLLTFNPLLSSISAGRVVNLRHVLCILSTLTSQALSSSPGDLASVDKAETLLIDLHPLLLDPDVSSTCLPELSDACDNLASYLHAFGSPEDGSSSSASSRWVQALSRVTDTISKAGPTHRAALKLSSWFGAKRRPEASREIGRVACITLIQRLMSSDCEKGGSHGSFLTSQDLRDDLREILGEAAKADVTSLLARFESDSKIDYWKLQSLVEAADVVMWSYEEGGRSIKKDWFVKWVGALDDKLGRSPRSAGVRKLLSSIKNCYS